MPKYQWTDWITHVPGQELPNGTYGIFEFHGRLGSTVQRYTVEGEITAEHKGHGSWHATVPGVGLYAVLERYKLRSVADELDVFRAMLNEPPTERVPETIDTSSPAPSRGSVGHAPGRP